MSTKALSTFSHTRALFVLITLFAAPALWGGAPPSNPGYQAGFPIELVGNFVRFSSIALGDLNNDQRPDIVFGASDGRLYAYSGTGSLLWQVDTGNMAIEGKAAIGDVDGDGFNEVVIGAGSTFTTNADGALYVFNHLGVEQCHFDTLDLAGTPGTFQEGVYSSPALADLDGNDGGRLEIVFGAWDHHVRALHHDCSVFWDVDTFDTVWSSPAIGDLDRDGSPEIVIGADSHFEPSPINTENGGRLHVFRANGTVFPGFPIQIDEVILSSPSLGDLDNDGFLDIVVGTGNFWANATGSDVGSRLNAWNRFGNFLSGWPRSIPGRYSDSSPALVDIDQDGSLEVVINARNRSGPVSNSGWVYVLNGNGTNVAGWPKQPKTPIDFAGGTASFATPASPVVADIWGDSGLEIILPSNGELVVWSRNGTQLSRQVLPNPAGAIALGANWTVSSSAGVGDLDRDGDLEVVVAGYLEFNQNDGALWAWDFSKPAVPAPPWPVFRRSVDNHAVARTEIFADGFASGNTSAWSVTVP